MFRMSIVGLCLVLTLQGCKAKKERPSRLEPVYPVAREATGKVVVLAFAEAILQERFPHAYQQHKPFTAEAVPNSMVWEVYPVSGVSPGAPIMTVRVGHKMQIQSYGLQE